MSAGRRRERERERERVKESIFLFGGVLKWFVHDASHRTGTSFVVVVAAAAAAAEAPIQSKRMAL